MSSIIDDLAKLSTHPKKRFGQNFLNDRVICKRIVSKIPLEKGSMITEIGPGLGALTEELLAQNFKVTALELDPDLAIYLRSKFKDKIDKDLKVENIDAIKEIQNTRENSDRYIVSNLPYNISSSLMGTLLDSIDLKEGTSGFKGAIIMFQKEFGERLTATPGGKEYGKISVMFQLKMDHETILKVPRDRFYPQPKVDGIVLKFSPKIDPIDIPDSDKTLRNLVHAAFLNRRKKLKNSLYPRSLDIDIEENKIRSILDEMGIINERPERLLPSTFVDLTNRLMQNSR